MCGIAGAIGWQEETAREAVEEMLARMVPRGPDDGGLAVLSSGHASAVLGNRRLAIIDLSAAGHQPMSDMARETTVVYNGMVYNFREVRRELEARGERFISQCDTEVVLHAYGVYGEDCLRQMQGMFAFALWDGRRRRLLIARDRLGIKPLYYAMLGERLVLASSIRALLASGLIDVRLSQDGVVSFLAYGAVSEPNTAIEGVKALPPGHYAVFEDGRLTINRYWEPPDVDNTQAHADPVAELRERLTGAVRSHLVSDAPLGLFLSGGLDSSMLASLAAREVRELHTISVLFEERRFTEGKYSDQTARHVGSRHTPVTVTDADLGEALNGAFRGMDQPTFDGVNTFLVARSAVEAGLKVAVSGLGADELFDGYGFVRRVRALERARKLALPLRRLGAVGAGVLLGAQRTTKARYWLNGAAEPGDSYDLLRRLFLDSEIAVLCDSKPPRAITTLDPNGDLAAQVSRLDIAHYMRNILLRDTDSMSMCQSLEVRVPYLDDTVVEWALQVPTAVRGTGKMLLTRAAKDTVPLGVLKRSKQGFALPLGRWMRGKLKQEVAERLHTLPTGLDGVLSQASVDSVWRDFTQTGHRWLRPWGLYALARWTDSVQSDDQPGERSR